MKWSSAKPTQKQIWSGLVLTEDHFTCLVCGQKYVCWAGDNTAVWHTSNHQICCLVGENLQFIIYYRLIPGNPRPGLGEPLQTRGERIPNSWFSSETDHFRRHRVRVCAVLVYSQYSTSYARYTTVNAQYICVPWLYVVWVHVAWVHLICIHVSCAIFHPSPPLALPRKAQDRM